MLTANTFKISLMLSAKICAEKFRRQQNSPKKSKQVYLNTLAVSAVKNYLNSLGWVTCCEQSDSWNPIMQTLMDVADLAIPNYGKIECRSVLLEQQELIVPPEVQSDRIAYIIVKFGSSLRECELLGFVPHLTTEQISLSQLQPIEQLTSYLRQYKLLQAEKTPQSLVELSTWWQGKIDDGWQLLEQVFPPEPALSFRSPNQLQEPAKIDSEERSELLHSPIRDQANTSLTMPSNHVDRLSQGISRVKLLDLGREHNCISIALVLQLVTQDSEEIDISAKICPTNTSLYLPQGLEIMILDETQKSVLQATAKRTNETIEFLFSGEPGEIFSIKASLNDNDIVETFII